MGRDMAEADANAPRGVPGWAWKRKRLSGRVVVHAPGPVAADAGAVKWSWPWSRASPGDGWAALSPMCQRLCSKVTWRASGAPGAAPVPSSIPFTPAALLCCPRYSVYASSPSAPPCWQSAVVPRPPSAPYAGAQTHGRRSCRRPLLFTLGNLSPHTDPTTASHDTPASQSAPLPARWSITNRIFNLVPRSIYDSPPRPPASRLWNPVNSSPRILAVQHPRARTRDEPNVPVQRPLSGAREEYPLLTLPERRLSRQSPAPSSLVVERSTGGDSGRASIGLPRDRRSLQFESPQTPQPAMVVGQEHAAAHVRHDAPGPGPRADDPELGAAVRKPSAARLSIPSPPASMHSRVASRQGNEEADGDDTSEFPWGPSHPCFPHPNPHVPLNSELYHSTRIIRIKRDWMVKGDLAPTFANLYPEILDPALPEEDFRKVVQKINDTLVDAFNPFSFRAWLDSIMGVATFWLWDDAGLTKVKKQLADLEKWIENWNRTHGVKEGVKIIPLRRTGYLTLDIQIPDPHLGPDNSTASRPNTQEELHENAAPQQGEYATYATTPTFQVNSPVAIESQS